MKRLVGFLAAACLIAALSTASFAGDASMTGWVSDAKCAAHAGPGKEACAKKCIEAGEKMVFVTDQDRKILSVDNPDALKDHIGHHVNVKGSVKGEALHVDSVTMLGS
ncbi:MAG TPA: hypothetical protein VEG30_11955 [Terriglobales bacterium]|nr:hypothetical protein [Terriglobales bacterium]